MGVIASFFIARSRILRIDICASKNISATVADIDDMPIAFNLM
ncbi:hypothetical protein PPL19_08146 [Pseudomonas psychrotolerans L19]|nr:hypothetical protein PPL19_08146 [Pseudomonas psychrotolerans L19]